MERYVRWQALSITQTSVLVSLLSALSLAGLSTSLSFVKDSAFTAASGVRGSLGLAFAGFAVCVLFSTVTVLSRAIDFRLTAREVRLQDNPSMEIKASLFGISSRGFGKITWFCVWSSFISFCVGSTSLAAAVYSVYFSCGSRFSAA